MLEFNKLKTLYQFSRDLSLGDVQELLRAAGKRSYERGAYLINEGSRKKEVFLIRKGLVRAFAINRKGDEITTLLRWENQVVASAEIILFEQPAQYYYEALEPTQVYVMDYKRLQAIIENNPKLEANRKYILQNILRQVLRRMDSFVLYTPEERYQRFVAANPEIVNRVPNKYIANILGITPVSLSRIRKRIADKKK